MASHWELAAEELAGGREPDPTLNILLGWAQAGFGFPVTLVVDGFLLTGVLAREQTWGKALNAQVLELVTRVEEFHRESSEGGLIPADQAAALEALQKCDFEEDARERHAVRSKRRGEIQAAIPDSGEWQPTELPGDLGRLWAREASRDRFLTLADASILIPPGRRDEIGTVRVAVDRIGAWWPAEIVASEDEAG
jgi:hypothetical protein